MNVNDIVAGMTPQEKEIYFSHMKKRHREEAEKMEAEREHLQVYKYSLIEDIIKHKPDYPLDQFQKMTTRTLERIAY